MDGSAGNSMDVEIARAITGPSAEDGQGILNLWLAFQIASGSVCLPILVLTFLFARNVQRHPMLINMCITWIIAGVAASLLFFAGKERGGEPPKPLCIAQTSLLYGVPPMASLSAFAVVYQVWTTLNAMTRLEPRRGRKILYFMLVLPYLGLIGFVVATAVFSARDPSKVTRSRRFFYCSLEFGKLSNAMAVFAAIVCFATLILEIHITFLLNRNLKNVRHAPSGQFHPSWRSLDTQLVGRIFVFSGYLIIALVFSAVSIISPRNIVPDMFAATMGLAVFLIFGTQPDVLRAWAFWLPKKPSRDLETYHSSPREGNYFDSTLTLTFDFGSASSNNSSSRRSDKKDPLSLNVSSGQTFDLRFSRSFDSKDSGAETGSTKVSRWSTTTEDIEQMMNPGSGVRLGGDSGKVPVAVGVRGRQAPFVVVRRPEDAFSRDGGGRERERDKRKSVVMQYGLAI